MAYVLNKVFLRPNPSKLANELEMLPYCDFSEKEVMLLAQAHRAIYFDLSTVRLLHASHQVNQSCLSAAIIAKQPQHLI